MAMDSQSLVRGQSSRIAHDSALYAAYCLRRYFGIGLLSLCPLVAVLGICLVAGVDEEVAAAVNTLAPLSFIAVLVWMTSHVARVSADLVWTGFVWFPIQSALFFGFGPLVEVLGAEATRRYIAGSPFAVTDWELLRANCLSVTGVTLVLLGFWLHVVLRGRTWRRGRSQAQSVTLNLQVALAMIAVGAAIKYLIVKPAQWSPQPAIIPGAVVGITAMIDVGMGILAFLGSCGGRFARTMLFVVWPVQFVLCVLSFSKMEVMLACFFPLIGSYAAHARRRRLVVGVLLTSIVFLAAQPFVSYARAAVYDRNGTINQAGYGDRLQILGSYAVGTTEGRAAESTEEADPQAWWVRLNYAGVQARAMSFYDRGNGNPALDTAWIYLIPRFIWADKPNLSLSAIDFHRLVTGDVRAESFLGISYYGDLYWQYGWLGVIVGCPLIGLVFAAMAARSLQSMRSRDFVMMPAVLLALNLSLIGPTEAVLNSVVGGTVIYVAYSFILNSAHRAMKQLSA